MRSISQRRSCFDLKQSEHKEFTDKFLFHYELSPITSSARHTKITERSHMFSRKMENRIKKETIHNK